MALVWQTKLRAGPIERVSFPYEKQWIPWIGLNMGIEISSESMPSPMHAHDSRMSPKCYCPLWFGERQVCPTEPIWSPPSGVLYEWMMHESSLFPRKNNDLYNFGQNRLRDRLGRCMNNDGQHTSQNYDDDSDWWMTKTRPCAPECRNQRVLRAGPNAMHGDSWRHEVSWYQIFHHIASFLKPKVVSSPTGIVSFTKGKRGIPYFHPKSKQYELVRARSPPKGPIFARSYEFLRF